MATEVAPTTKGRKNDAWGARRVTILRVQLSNSYATGGESFIPKAFGHVGDVSIVDIRPRFAAGATGPNGRTFVYDYTNQKIVVFDSVGTQTANATDLSGTVLDIFVITG